jgi:CRISPR-associated protein Cmr5
VKTIEQRRAAAALSRVNELGSNSDGFKKRYRAYVDRLCPTIVMNGLGQALATERAAAGPQPSKDDERAHHELYLSLQRWLCGKDDGVYSSAADLLQAIISNDEALYLHAQAEALAWLEWHKKFCRASFPKGVED